MEVVVSIALPRFSIKTYASAVWPGIPYPSEDASPEGPMRDSPRVLRASIGIQEVSCTVESVVRVAVTSMYPSSSPSASLGNVATKGMDNGVEGTSSTPSKLVPTLGSTVHPSGRFAESYAMSQFAVREPVAMIVISTSSEAPGSTLVTVSGP